MTRPTETARNILVSPDKGPCPPPRASKETMAFWSRARKSLTAIRARGDSGSEDTAVIIEDRMPRVQMRTGFSAYARADVFASNGCHVVLEGRDAMGYQGPTEHWNAKKRTRRLGGMRISLDASTI